MESRTLQLIKKEQERQNSTIELIASENFVSDDVLYAVGSCLTNKYSEGYPYVRESGNKGRYYGGTSVVDELEEYCCGLFRELFKTDYHVNVQPHSGSQANMAAYFALLKPGDSVLGMDMNGGGHLTHGAAVSFSGKLFNITSYSVDETGFINYDEVQRLAEECRPRMIIAGASAYSRILDFERFRKIADSVGAYLMADIAHIAGLIAGGVHPSPFGIADIVATTTHKTLRGARGGVVFCRQEFAKKIDSAVFPCLQGGPLQHVIAGKAICAEEALRSSFADYAKNVVASASAMAAEFVRLGRKVVTGGTENHLFLLDLSDLGMSGKYAQELLEANDITLNKNMVPNDPLPPQKTSGIRIGTAAMTTKGYKPDDFVKLAQRINDILVNNPEEA